MQKIRILIVTHSHLSPEFGAGQVAIHLAEEFRKQGHDVTLWSPHPMPYLPRWWQQVQSSQLMRAKLDEFLDSQEPFDVIDCMAGLITKKVSLSASVIVSRSVQPDILYIISSFLNPKDKGLRKIGLFLFNILFGLFCIFLSIQGWSRATYILCLGSLELEWMKKWFPWWRNKFFSYLNTISKDEQIELAKIRLNRTQQEQKAIRFIWIGRWVAHKGIRKLVKFIIQRTISNPQDTFTIAGCGNSPKQDFPSELIQSGKLKIIPSFKRNELYSLLANHDVGLFTSEVEGWGLTLNEMLESGLPVFATQAGGVPDLQPFFETLMPFPPPEYFIPTLGESPQSLQNYYTLYSWEKIAETYADVLIKKLDFNNNCQ